MKQTYFIDKSSGTLEIISLGLVLLNSSTAVGLFRRFALDTAAAGKVQRLGEWHNFSLRAFLKRKEILL